MRSIEHWAVIDLLETVHQTTHAAGNRHATRKQCTKQLVIYGMRPPIFAADDDQRSDMIYGLHHVTSSLSVALAGEVKAEHDRAWVFAFCLRDLRAKYTQSEATAIGSPDCQSVRFRVGSHERDSVSDGSTVAFHRCLKTSGDVSYSNKKALPRHNTFSKFLCEVVYAIRVFS